jgi:DNA-binding GntR family transcriptional regulator
LNGKLIRSFGVSRSTLYRGLRKMEDANLITVEQRIGQSPIVTILQ